jgi:hypothetical protein
MLTRTHLLHLDLHMRFKGDTPPAALTRIAVVAVQHCHNNIAAANVKMRQLVLMNNEYKQYVSVLTASLPLLA